MPGYKTKIITVFFMIAFLFILTGCETLSDLGIGSRTTHDAAFLTLELDQPYGIEELSPGSGRYRYDRDATAEIKVVANSGYEFLGWAGPDGGNVGKVSDRDYRLKMSENKRIRTDLRYNDFLLLNIEFDDYEIFDFNDTSETLDISHTVEKISFRFNNRVSGENDLEVWIEDPEAESGNEENNSLIRNPQLEIVDNYIVTNIEFWFEDFVEIYFDDEEDRDDIKFEKEYILNIESNFANNIFDIDNKEYNEEIISLSFQIEEPMPKTPEIIGIAKENGDVEISWHRTESITKFAVDDYVTEYIIQRSINDRNFDNNITEFFIAVDLEMDDKPVKINSYNDSDINLSNNIYFYRIIAVNEFGNRSEPSEIKSTKN